MLGKEEKQKNVTNEVATPTLDRMLEIRDQAQICGEFLDWFLCKYSVFDRRAKRESPVGYVTGSGDYISKERLLAEFFGIDLDEAEREKQAILSALDGGESEVS